LKLLFDHNISHKLVARVLDLFPESSQTRLLNLGRTNDPQLWLIAKTHVLSLLRRIKMSPNWRSFAERRRKFFGFVWATARPS
jgi:hypothetical protein